MFITDNIDHENTPKSEIYTKINKNKEMLHCIRVVLRHFEIISICIQESFVDESVIYKYMGSMVSWYYTALETYIAGVRKQGADNIIYIEFGKIASSWKYE